MTQPTIFWFRQDLRLADHPALTAAVATGNPLLACYVLDDVTPGEWAMGGASRWWLHHSLAWLQGEIEAIGGRLVLLKGAAAVEIPALAEAVDASAVYCSRQVEDWAVRQEEETGDLLAAQEVAFERIEGALLFSPEELRTGAGEPFKVFTPFWRRALTSPAPPTPLQRPRNITFHKGGPKGLKLDALALTPGKPDWAAHWGDYWQPGSEGARKSLRKFLDKALDDYDESRNHPARQATSRLSPHLHFGEVSPRQVWYAVHAHCNKHDADPHQRDKFLSELGWREFSHHLLWHNPGMATEPFNTRFEQFPWLGQPEHLERWQRGMTGYPIVDAGMRELWHTGYMHNRVRMVVASFLTKHLLLPWQAGERWFWDTLVDADLANNACGWQWVAGCGADAAPYFRIFNPTLQGKRFDADGAYVKRWVPELAELPAKYLHEPAKAPKDVLEEAGVTLGETYPHPIVEHAAAREAALAAYASLKEDQGARAN